MRISHYVGLDLAWKESIGKKNNESGIVMLNAFGEIIEAVWTIGIQNTIDWLKHNCHEQVLLFVDAPLVVNNQTGQRLCEKQIGQRYWRWKVSANSTNLRKTDLAGKVLFDQLLSQGWEYHDGIEGPRFGCGRFFSECYPYTSIVGAQELNYEFERPCYKRKPKGMNNREFRNLRKNECDKLIRRVGGLKNNDPPMDLSTHPETNHLLSQESPLDDRDYKHREDLLDAAICAWTAALWCTWGLARCQVLGGNDVAVNGFRSTIIAPARPEQRV